MRARRVLASLALLVAALAAACAPPSSVDAGPRLDAGLPPADAGPPDTGYPAPRTDLVAPVGSPSSLDVATWNIENFPATPETARIVADVIASLDLDLIAVQEIADVEAFEEVVARLPEHHGILSSHAYGDGSYQKVGFLYREDLLAPSDVRLLFPGSGYEFPRPPLQATFTALGEGEPFAFIAVVVHLKAGLSQEDTERRTQAMIALEEHIRNLVDGPADDEVIVLGDFNDVLTNEFGRAVFAPFLQAPSRYRIHTQGLADAGAKSFLPSEVVLDHIITTSALDDEVAGASAVIPPLDEEVGGYQSVVSDHLPVVMRLPGAL